MNLPGNAILRNGGLKDGNDANREIRPREPAGWRRVGALGEELRGDGSGGGQCEDHLLLVVLEKGLKQARQGAGQFGKLLAPPSNGREPER